jgi:hypothetical protein
VGGRDVANDPFLPSPVHMFCVANYSITSSARRSID